MSVHSLTIETLSPVHIGAGGPDLRRNIDFAIFGKTLYMLNIDAVLEAMLPENPNDRYYQQILNAPDLGSLVTAEQLSKHPELYYYKLEGVSKLETMRPAIKQWTNAPYIPGSSLKGALRSAWVRQQYQQRNLSLDLDRLNDRREWAFQGQEARLLSPKAPRPAQVPNYDLFRAIQVSDSQAAPDDSLRLYNAVVFPAANQGIPLDLEAIKPRMTLQARIKFDDYILETQAKHFGVHEQGFSFEALKQAWREQGIARIQQELTFWMNRREGEHVQQFFSNLEQQANTAPENCFFIDIGWGTGWKSKTLGDVIKTPQLAKLMQRYRLTRKEYREGDRFPKTRRAARDTNGNLRVPFGWIKVTLN
ncbi:type III-A CRISPR-associated RAMP protein Csm5 [Herpetosiphon giganteus]|uniref:type III-A CRISPR-associated RAMP protein Csm5 n=1 Tax=Herpetosiphon giganteus TaxID=2029754 RepID=UPI0019569CB3|nr:type III-A CRISPR-associated RAMP protein Csm5 [Herpetosiphon giganteus]MBM7846601.1 CRISPR-associated protein Csm5 [Herpetosiphon giganteus]